MPWLVRRMLHHIAEGSDVRLVVESGTTLKAALDKLGPCLQGNPDVARLDQDQIQIITNNFPGAESYEAFASQIDLAGRKLNDLIPCELVPGRALQEYAAVVGSKAEAYLRDWCRPKQHGRKIVRIGLTVGNWVMLEGTPARAIPLARGAGHKAFKEAVFASCDEIYFISPLCKIIKADRRRSAADSLNDFNQDLLNTVPTEPDQKGAYMRVDLDSVQPDRDRIKLVTTYRSKSTSIVRLHSRLIMESLEVEPSADYGSALEKPIRELEHFVYCHDTHSDFPFGEQLKVELPHSRTRVKWFRSKYFSIE
jgi:hypothetical protein